MKIVIFGANGLLGLELTKLFSGGPFQIVPLNLSDVDIRSELVTDGMLGGMDFDLLIYAKGFEDVNAAEVNEKMAFDVNATGALNLAKVCKQQNAAMIYISTGYVFDGLKNSPYIPEDKPNPLNVYGKSKYEAEKNIMSVLNNYYIIRTGKLFGTDKPDFIDELIVKAKDNQTFNAFNDLYYTPTWTFTLAKSIEKLIDTTKLKINFGIYHCTNSGSCSDFDFIAEVVRAVSLFNKVYPLKFSEVQHKVKIPQYNVLDSSKAPGIRIHWVDALHNYLDQIRLKK